MGPSPAAAGDDKGAAPAAGRSERRRRDVAGGVAGAGAGGGRGGETAVGAASRGGSVTRVAVVRAWAGCVCSARCDDPLILAGNMRDAGWAVTVNVAIGADGADLAPGVVAKGARWGRLEVYHPKCYERVGAARWGAPSRDARRERLVARKRIPY